MSKKRGKSKKNKLLGKRRHRDRSDLFDHPSQAPIPVVRSRDDIIVLDTQCSNLARYKCLECGHTFDANPGAHSCPKCKHLYLEWTNYEESWGSGSH